ncbi:hypothetical protein AR438_00635 [Chryseobacterium aquaticum]|uniref:Bacteriocin n=1 Tax=Chryseobacterium aquaticum TaxID=452084 RepID=A0A0Q3HV72_9FLAO|nr:hypothetical protein [Chryseobacterium aquaticum]KQK26760.1 hypothetical protein AR438_00635 [Chryseobacterium aquaticum]
MKNLKKLSRGEMKTVGGGEWGAWSCCNFNGQCSTPVFGNSDTLFCFDSGTHLRKMNKGISEDIN